MEEAAAGTPEPWVAVAASASADFVPTGRKEPQPPSLDAGWRRLGLDVVDGGGTSGLMNMGFLPDLDDVSALRERWGSHLNEDHLFEDPEPAERFRAFSDERVPEHAPFFVAGLWMRCSSS